MERLEASGGIERQELFQQLQRACKNPDAVFYSVMRLGGSFSAQGMHNTNWKRECKDIWKLMQDACREVEMALPGPDEVLSLVAQCDSDINSDISSDIKKVRNHMLPYFGLDGVRAAALYHVGDLVTINGSQRPTLWRICALSVMLVPIAGKWIFRVKTIATSTPSLAWIKAPRGRSNLECSPPWWQLTSSLTLARSR